MIVLCELEGQTRKDAAKQLAVPEGTVAGWLARAKAMLAKRLTRQGVALSGGAPASLLAENLAQGAAPRVVTATTIRAAGLLATGQSFHGVVSPRAALSKTVLTAMFFAKCKAVAITIMAPLLCMCLVLGAMHTNGFFTGQEANALFDLTFAATALPLPPARDKQSPNSSNDSAPSDPQPKEPPKNFTNSLGIKFVWIPPGNFLMGSPKGEKLREEEGENLHKVVLTKGFYMSVYPVTQEEYFAVMGSHPSKFRGKESARGTSFLGRLPGVYQETSGNRQEGVPTADRSGVGIRLPGRDNNAVPFWGRDLHRSGEFQRGHVGV